MPTTTIHRLPEQSGMELYELTQRAASTIATHPLSDLRLTVEERKRNESGTTDLRDSGIYETSSFAREFGQLAAELTTICKAEEHEIVLAYVRLGQPQNPDEASDMFLATVVRARELPFAWIAQIRGRDPELLDLFAALTPDNVLEAIRWNAHHLARRAEEEAERHRARAAEAHVRGAAALALLERRKKRKTGHPPDDTQGNAA